jgi:hypothetical protein
MSVYEKIRAAYLIGIKDLNLSCESQERRSSIA